jgi:type IV secretion system protein VirB10
MGNESGPPMQVGQSGESGGGESEGGQMTLASLLKPTPIAAVRARVLPTQRFLIPKGAFIDCTLETAINSSLPGMTTCITATDTFSADGTVVLLERGSKLVGETRGEVQRGQPRLFVLWTEARTPTGVVVPLASPGTDELGRSGLSGEIDRHWWLRFGSAILITVIDGLIQGTTESRGNGGTIVLNPSGTSTVATEVLRGTMNIPPTIEKAQGDRIEILVARDVDFRSVYAVHADAGAP